MSQRAFPIRASRPIQPGEATSPGTGGCLISCSAEGWVRLILANGDFVEVYAEVGTMALTEISVAGVGTSAAHTPLATDVVVNVVDY